MIRVEQNMFYKLSFHDQQIYKIDLYEEDKILKIYTSGAFDCHEQRCLDDGLIIFNNWKSISVSRFKNKDSSFEVTKISELDTPKNMDYYDDNEEDKVVFGGFTNKSGPWVQWTIIGATYYAEFEGYDPTPH